MEKRRALSWTMAYIVRLNNGGSLTFFRGSLLTAMLPISPSAGRGFRVGPVTEQAVPASAVRLEAMRFCNYRRGTSVGISTRQGTFREVMRRSMNVKANTAGH